MPVPDEDMDVDIGTPNQIPSNQPSLDREMEEGAE
ncbi:hypothetical protein COLO4_06738 [Corchorus olitorius]|uniref:Uncharacterized protein n=1 Tax=Corchorus olitorius TaxID=93759 RepID=A0A1R3KM50_9ROSI|nr:hypothetical protein COLO4_06738 [Corchorus olitorius]